MSVFTRYARALIGTHRTPIRKPAARTRLGLTPLEAREVPAYLSGYSLFIDGTPWPDTVTVSSVPRTLFTPARVQVVENGVSQSFAASALAGKTIVFLGGGGADRFTNTAGLPTYAVGGAGDDTLTGSSAVDWLYGSGGNDSLVGGGGGDLLFGEEDNDRVFGQGGSDYIQGGPGADWLVGCTDGNPAEDGGADDTITGGEGNDVLWGGDGRDRLSGEGGSDLIHGEGGDDWLIGCTDGNAYEAGGADDTIYAGAGNDVLWGGDGADKLYGEGGADWMNGEGGNDLLFGGATADRDTLTGAGGADVFLSMNNEDTVVDRTGEDGRLNFGGDGARFWSEAEVMMIAQGAAWLQARTGNCRLLRTASAGDIPMLRVTYLTVPSSGGAAAAVVTSDGNAMFADRAFRDAAGVAFDPADVAGTFVHEMGHFWDKEGPLWGTWLQMSGWRERAWWEQIPATGSAPGLSLDYGWTYNPSAEFARDYGRTNPMEDWSTCWEVYYRAKTKPGDPAAAAEYVRLLSKMMIIDMFFNWAAQ